MQVYEYAYIIMSTCIDIVLFTSSPRDMNCPVFGLRNQNSPLTRFVYTYLNCIILFYDNRLSRESITWDCIVPQYNHYIAYLFYYIWF